MFKKSMFLVAILFAGLSVFAQSLDEAGAKYNEGNEQYSAKQYSTAVKTFEEALSICNTVGAEADGLKGSIQKQLNNAYYKNGLSLYKKKKFDDAIAELKKCSALSDEIGDAAKSKKSLKYVGKIHTTKGQYAVKGKKADDALAEFNKALEYNPKSYKTYLGMAMAYKEKGDIDNMLSSADKAIELTNGNEKAAKYAAKAKKLASSTLFNAGAEELTKEHGAKAAEYFNKSLNYTDGNADTYYYLAVANNKAKSFAKAIEAANKALSMKEGDKSDIYFELGTAQQGSGDNGAACDSYKKVTAGSNVEAAKYKVTTELKCK